MAPNFLTSYFPSLVPQWSQPNFWVRSAREKISSSPDDQPKRTR